MRKIYRLLVIHPSSTSTKIRIYDNEKCIIEERLQHDAELLHQFSHMTDQYIFRKNAILDSLHEQGINIARLNAVVCTDPALLYSGGICRVNERMLEDLRNANFEVNVYQLGVIMAYTIANQLNIPAFMVDATAVADELQVVAEKGLRVLRGEEVAQYKPLLMLEEEDSGKLSEVE